MLNVTCLACGCLCDDIRIVVDDNRIVEAEHACPVGRRWFLTEGSTAETPAAVIDGHPSELAEAIERASEILRSAKAPVVWGLTDSTVEAVASALRIADRIGAVVDLAGGPGSISGLDSFQRVGQVSASLGEVKDRADLVVFWGVDPVVTHPRHWERYSVEPRGRFIPNGRAGRFVIVVDSEPTETSRNADLFIQIDRDRQAEALNILRALVQGLRLDPDRASRSAEIESSALESLAGQLLAARYGAIFFEPEATMAESMLRLTRDLNEGRRFVALELGTPGNASGAKSVLTWQAGAASAVDYTLGYPRHLPREATLEARLEAAEVDAVLLVVGVFSARPSAELVARLGSVATILIGPELELAMTPTVSFRTARPGIEAGGTVARVDGLMLPLTPVITTHLPTDRSILDAICERLES